MFATSAAVISSVCQGCLAGCTSPGCGTASLQVLSLSGSALGEAGTSHLAKALAVPAVRASLRLLDVCHCQLAEVPASAGARALFGALAKLRLARLALSGTTSPVAQNRTILRLSVNHPCYVLQHRPRPL